MAIDVSRLEKVDFVPASGFACDEVYVDRRNGVCVQVWWHATPGCDGTPWEGTLRVAVRHTSARNMKQYERSEFSKPITWDDLQAIKDRFWPDRIGIEVYPPNDKIVNVADLRWMWVLPLGAMLPFNLQSSNPSRLCSGGVS